MILTNEDYFNIHTDSIYIDYINRVSENSIRCGFLKWDNNESWIWSGDYNGCYCAFIIDSYSNAEPLLTKAEMDIHQLKSDKYCSFSWPPNILYKYFDNDILVDYGFKFHFDDSDKVYVRNQLTEDEYNHLISVCTGDELNIHKSKLELLNSCFRWSNCEFTVETPIRLYLYGTDDTSYSIFVDTIETANETLIKLEKLPTFDNLKSLNGHFTN